MGDKRQTSGRQGSNYFWPAAGWLCPFPRVLSFRLHYPLLMCPELQIVKAADRPQMFGIEAQPLLSSGFCWCWNESLRKMHIACPVNALSRTVVNASQTPSVLHLHVYSIGTIVKNDSSAAKECIINHCMYWLSWPFCHVRKMPSHFNCRCSIKWNKR